MSLIKKLLLCNIYSIYMYTVHMYYVYYAGDEYLPFAEIPSLRNMALTGEDDEDMSYMRIQGYNTHLYPRI